MYPIMQNCNFESRNDATGQAVHAARQAAEADLTDDTALIEALESLEDVLEELADKTDTLSMRACDDAENVVAAAWTENVREAAESARELRYVD